MTIFYKWVKINFNYLRTIFLKSPWKMQKHESHFDICLKQKKCLVKKIKFHYLILQTFTVTPINDWQDIIVVLNIKIKKLYNLFCLLWARNIYTGTPNSDIRKLCTVHCGRNLNKPSAPTDVKGKDCSSEVIL